MFSVWYILILVWFVFDLVDQVKDQDSTEANSAMITFVWHKYNN